VDQPACYRQGRRGAYGTADVGRRGSVKRERARRYFSQIWLRFCVIRLAVCVNLKQDHTVQRRSVSRD
jgi:hypothetical protein